MRVVRADHPDLSSRSMPTVRTGWTDAGQVGAWPSSACSVWSNRCRRPIWPPQAELARADGRPVCLDESLSSLHRVRDALRYGSCAVACLKPARLGGLRAARAAHAACAAAGVPVFVGGFFEAGLGRASNLVVGRPSEHGRGRVRRATSTTRLTISKWIPAAIRPSSTGGSGCRRDPASAARLIRESWPPGSAATLVSGHLHLTIHASSAAGATNPGHPRPPGPSP